MCTLLLHLGPAVARLMAVQYKGPHAISQCLTRRHLGTDQATNVSRTVWLGNLGNERHFPKIQ